MIIMETTQPNYSESIHKFEAREFIIRLKKLITGKVEISKNKHYVTLANLQDKSASSEINQMINAGVITPDQFVGIDYNKHFINKNKRFHRDSTWIHGDWNVILSSRKFDPEIVYLDSTHFASLPPSRTSDRDPPVVNTLKNTLNACKEGTLVVCNVMETNPRCGLGEQILNTTDFIEKLLHKEHPAKYRDWNKDHDRLTMQDIENSEMRVPHYRYKTNKTLMKSYIFYKGILPSEDIMQKEYAEFDKWCDDFERKYYG